NLYMNLGASLLGRKRRVGFAFPHGAAASGGGMRHARGALTMVPERGRVGVRPAAVALLEQRAPDVFGLLRTSAPTHPCSAGVGDGNLGSLRHFVVRRRAQDVTRARIGLLAQL